MAQKGTNTTIYLTYKQIDGIEEKIKKLKGVSRSSYIQDLIDDDLTKSKADKILEGFNKK